jgi:hypothetical protein
MCRSTYYAVHTFENSLPLDAKYVVDPGVTACWIDLFALLLCTALLSVPLSCMLLCVRYIYKHCTYLGGGGGGVKNQNKNF